MVAFISSIAANQAMWIKDQVAHFVEHDLDLHLLHRQVVVKGI